MSPGRPHVPPAIDSSAEGLIVCDKDPTGIPDHFNIYGQGESEFAWMEKSIGVAGIRYGLETHWIDRQIYMHFCYTLPFHGERCEDRAKPGALVERLIVGSINIELKDAHAAGKLVSLLLIRPSLFDCVFLRPERRTR